MSLFKNTFFVLAIRMIGFGIFVGIIFPFFVHELGVPKSIAFSNIFLVSCVMAGILVGFINIIISSITVKKKLIVLVNKMNKTKDTAIEFVKGDCINGYKAEEHCIQPDSDDEFGLCTQTFNELLVSFADAIRLVDDIKTLTSLFASQLNLKELSKSALELIMESTGADAGAILIKEDDEIRILESFGIQNTKQLLVDSNILSVFSKGETCYISRPDEIKDENMSGDASLEEMIVEPVKFSEIPYAVILLAKIEPFKTMYLKRLGIIAQSFAIALHNALEHEQLQKVAALDSLTGALNRCFGMMRLHNEYHKVVQLKIHLGILMLDIDYFKQINDHYGHIIGDRVIKEVADSIRSAIRECDILMRYGGDEFVVILPGTSRVETVIVAERIQEIIRENKLKSIECEVGVTTSAGCDSFPESVAKDELELIANADKAMYISKNSGRDKVTLYEIPC